MNHLYFNTGNIDFEYIKIHVTTFYINNQFMKQLMFMYLVSSSLKCEDFNQKGDFTFKNFH